MYIFIIHSSFVGHQADFTSLLLWKESCDIQFLKFWKCKQCNHLERESPWGPVWIKLACGHVCEGYINYVNESRKAAHCGWLHSLGRPQVCLYHLIPAWDSGCNVLSHSCCCEFSNNMNCNLELRANMNTFSLKLLFARMFDHSNRKWNW